MVKLLINKTLLKANSHLKKGEKVEAEALYKAILKAFPANKKAQLGLAKLKKLTTSTISQDPSKETIEQLINLYNADEFEAVIENADVITQKYPNSFLIWNILGAAAARASKLDLAISAFHKATVVKPDYAEGFYNLGNAFKDHGRLDEAISSYKKALCLNSSYSQAFYNMGMAYKNQFKFEKALEAYQKAIHLKPDYVEAINNIGNILHEQGKLIDAKEAFQKAISIKPGYVKAYKNLANLVSEQGERENAIVFLKKALKIDPNYAEAHRSLSALIKYRLNDPQFKIVSDLLNNPKLKDKDRCLLNYTFAKMNEDIGDFKAAFENYQAGGAIRQKLLGYDKGQDEWLFNKIKIANSNIKENCLNEKNRQKKLTPIFILGMPRSGTTLVEQIVSSHSQIQGAGELKFLGNAGGSIGLGKKEATREILCEVRKSYLTELMKISSGKPFVTDKMPHNFLYIGLILNAIPEAKIIHVERNPAATCWSNFKHYFSADGLGYSYNLRDTVSYFKRYQDLMDFWNRKYPEQIHNFNYDKLTLEQEKQTKRLIAYLNLDWEEQCLLPQKNKRSVRTASQLQIRKKIYKGSSEVWRKFEPFLNGIFDDLNP